MLVKVFTGAVYGIESIVVTVEVNILPGAQFVMVGLPDTAVKESRQRIDSALREIGERIPGKRVIVNMAPAAIKKEGAAFDLPLAVGILAANGKISPAVLQKTLITGEISLDGTLQPSTGILPTAIAARQAGFERIILPAQNINEASAVKGIEIAGFSKLSEVVAFLSGTISKPLTAAQATLPSRQPSYVDFADIRGQENAKRAMEIAACGAHNILLIGPPGAGKTMLSKSLPSILPPMTEEEMLEVSKIHSVAGLLQPGSGILTERPFRTPHHSASESSLIGGGTFPKPGEISLASGGCLYLDELPEFKRHTLELLRQPLEERKIMINRNSGSVAFPADFILAASMNPCPCGYYSHPSHVCSCREHEIKRYLSKLSGPLLDRIDMHIHVPPVDLEKLASITPPESSAAVRERVIAGRRMQTERCGNSKNIRANSQMDGSMIRKFCPLDKEARMLLSEAVKHYGASARTYERIIKLARTIADLGQREKITSADIAEALQYRCLDLGKWGISRVS